MITAWRLLKAKHADHAFDGEGARLYGGRWNSPGTAVTYCSATASLAILEVFANVRRSALLAHYVLISCTFDESLVRTIDVTDLQRNWRQSPAPSYLATIGDEWVCGASSAVLRVPSALLDHERNYLINPNHRDFRRIKVSSPEPYTFDLRLVEQK